MFQPESPFMDGKSAEIIERDSLRVSCSSLIKENDNLIFLVSGYFAKGQKDINLIYVNWEASSQTINYIAARNRVEEIGKYVAEMIDFLVQNTKVKLNDINVIGFSLGAHIAGHSKLTKKIFVLQK